MSAVGFEPTISAGKRLETYALDRAATGTGSCYSLPERYVIQAYILHKIWEMFYAQSFLINIHDTVIYFPFYSRLVAKSAIELRTKQKVTKFPLVHVETLLKPLLCRSCYSEYFK
jgi:hypothetical protein